MALNRVAKTVTADNVEWLNGSTRNAKRYCRFDSVEHWHCWQTLSHRAAGDHVGDHIGYHAGNHAGNHAGDYSDASMLAPLNRR